MLLLTVNFVHSAEAWDAGPEFAHFRVPGGQAFVGVFPSGVKDENAGVGLVVVGWVHRLELFLSCRVPKVNQHFLPVLVADSVTKEVERVSRQPLRGEAVNQVAFNKSCRKQKEKKSRFEKTTSYE